MMEDKNQEDSTNKMIIEENMPMIPIMLKRLPSTANNVVEQMQD